MTIAPLGSFLLILHILIVTHLSITEGLLHPKRFSRPSDTQNVECPIQGVVSRLMLDKKLKCALMCKRTSACRTFMYSNNLKVCILCREHYSSTGGFSLSEGYSYYSDYTRNYHLGCTTDADCKEENNICILSTNDEKLCVCEHGYSLLPETMTCVNGCTTYGNTYELYRHYYLSGNDNAFTTDMSLESCKESCASATEFQCRIVERHVDGRCWFSSDTALTKPYAYGPYDWIDLYNRNCAQGRAH